MIPEDDTRDTRRASDRIVPERGTISGSGSGMSDEEALAVLRRVEPKPGAEEPDIEVVVSPSVSRHQTRIPSSFFGKEADLHLLKPFASQHAYSYSSQETKPSEGKIVVNAENLSSTVRSVLDRGHVLPLAEDALGKGEPLRMRLFLGKSTIDLDLSEEQLGGLDLTLDELIARAVR